MVVVATRMSTSFTTAAPTTAAAAAAASPTKKYWIFEDPLTVGLPLFLIQVVFILCIVRLLGKVLHKLKQPMVIGEIIAGILLGPSALGQIPGFSAALFPTSSTAFLSLFANIGLIFFMFFLGLEVDPNLMKKSWQTSLPISIAAIIVPFSIGIGLSQWLINIDTNRSNNDELSFVLFIGIATSFTAFPVLARILTSANLVNSGIGMQALSCAAIDDVMAWCCLAIVLSIATGHGVEGLYVTLIAILFISTMYFVARPLLHFIHQKLLEQNDELNRNFIAFILLLLCVNAWFAEILGIHAFFGAFAFGVMVPRGGKLIDELAPKIEMLIVEFFLPLYFANSGLNTNILSLDTAEAWGAVIVVTFCAGAGKMCSTMVMARLLSRCQKSWRWCATLGVLMNTRGLVTLIALNIGLNAGILGIKSFTIYVIMSLITTFITSPALYHLYEKPYHAELMRAAAALAAQQQQAAELAELRDLSQLEMHDSSDDAAAGGGVVGDGGGAGGVTVDMSPKQVFTKQLSTRKLAAAANDGKNASTTTSTGIMGTPTSAGRRFTSDVSSIPVVTFHNDYPVTTSTHTTPQITRPSLFGPLPPAITASLTTTKPPSSPVSFASVMVASNNYVAPNTISATSSPILLPLNSSSAAPSLPSITPSHDSILPSQQTDFNITAASTSATPTIPTTAAPTTMPSSSTPPLTASSSSSASSSTHVPQLDTSTPLSVRPVRTSVTGGGSGSSTPTGTSSSAAAAAAASSGGGGVAPSTPHTSSSSSSNAAVVAALAARLRGIRPHMLSNHGETERSLTTRVLHVPVAEDLSWLMQDDFRVDAINALLNPLDVEGEARATALQLLRELGHLHPPASSTDDHVV